MTIKNLFKAGKEPLLNIYFTAGFPHLNSMPEILSELETSGVDMVEIGIPYSDPLSDGPTIQKSSAIAIKNGITTDRIFEQLAKSSSKVPKIIMAYFNSVFLYGIEKFCSQCVKTGVEGVILPDLPIDIYLERYQTIFKEYGIHVIFLISPQTSDERIRLIDKHSTLFIYAASSSSTTGKETGIYSAKDYLSRLKAMCLDTPLMVGFNISSKEDFEFAASYTSGGIIGSAFIKRISNSKNLRQDVQSFVQSIK